MVIIGNKAHKDAPAPNMSLNSHHPVWRGELHAVALFATVLQLGVLTYSGFATYYPTLQFPKDDRPVADYAFPCTAAGTLVLVAGMLVCAHVVESSTTEERYQASEGRQVQLVWLQQTKTVSDQVFGSYAVFPDDCRTIITSSRRAGPDGQPLASAGRATRAFHSIMRTVALAVSPNHDGTDEHVPASVLAVKTVLGTMVSLCGFIVQFIGLRGMHWSASVAQLGAVVMMTSVRAWVRRGLAKPPRYRRLPSGFELEWFATTLGDLTNAPWLPKEKSSNSSGSGGDGNSEVTWRIETGGRPETYEKLGRTGMVPDPGPTENSISKAHTIMTKRKELGQYTNWRGLASTEAAVLARAIEVAMGALFSPSLHDDLTWSLKVHCGRLDTQPDTQPIHFQLKQINGTWEADEDGIEAALSMWLYSMRDKEQDQHQQGHEQQESPGNLFPNGGARLHTKGSSVNPGLRLLGLNSVALRRDLQWWTPNDAVGIIEVGEDSRGRLEVVRSRVVGCAAGQGDASQKSADQNSRYKSRELAKLSFDQANDKLVDEGESYAFLATETYDPLKSLYAKHMFSAFMWAAVKTLTSPIKGAAEIRSRDISGMGKDDWNSFTLRNDHLSTMAQNIHNTGLGSLEEIYLSIIPPLSAEDKLPHMDAIVELVRQHAKQHEQLQHWKQAGESYLWLLRMASTFPEQSRIATKATAVLMEYLRTVTLELGEDQRYGERDIKQLEELKSTLEEELRTVDRGILSSLMALYKEQGRTWECVPRQEAPSGQLEDTSYPETFKFTELHRLTQTTDVRKLEQMLEKEDVNLKDIHDWTPLHYAAAKGSADAIEILLEHQAHVNAPDILEWTPLHYACQRGDTSIVQRLVQKDAELDVRSRGGVAPLHCAAMNGHVDVVYSMIKAGAALDVLDASRNTLLHHAAGKGHETMAKLLASELGADSEARDRGGRRPLHHAAGKGHEAMVMLLANELGADKEAKDVWGQRPLHHAAGKGYEAMVRLLVKLGANKEAKDDSGWTPLYHAVVIEHEAMVRLLVKLGADKEAKDDSSRTPLYYAASMGIEAMVRLLAGELGADKEAKDGGGRTPLHLAEENGHEAVARLLA